MFPECVVPRCPAASSLYTSVPEREALATILVEWHYLIVGWALSAESGMTGGRGCTSVRLWCDPVEPPHTPVIQGCQNKPCCKERRAWQRQSIQEANIDTEGFYLSSNTQNRYKHIYSVSSSGTYCCCIVMHVWLAGRQI